MAAASGATRIPPMATPPPPTTTTTRGTTAPAPAAGMDITVESGTLANATTASGSGGTKKKQHDAMRHQLMASKTWKAVWTGRLIFVTCLVCVATTMGVVSWYFLTESETNLAESQFEAIAERAIQSAQEIVVRKRLGTISMASVVANAFPTADQWPFVYMQGYEQVASNLIETSSGREMGFCPLVVQSQLSDFETHAYKWFQEWRQPPFSNTTAVSSFGKGIWRPDPTCGCADNRSHVITATTTTWESRYNVVAPILQHHMGGFPALMLNLHFEPTRGTIIDDLITCSGCTISINATTGQEYLDCPSQSHLTVNTTTTTTTSTARNCGAVTDMLFLTSQAKETGPSALLMEPIHPARDGTKLVGLIASSIVWDESLKNVFSSDVSGVDCVLSTQFGQSYTYGVVHGVPVVRGKGDLHDVSHDEWQRDIILTPIGLFSNTSAIYTLRLYPTNEFYETYSTRNPRMATIGAVCIIVFTTAMFFLYDFCVRKEFDARQDLLEAKRKFVRFVSHEVRTPLNTVCMGLGLMEEEMAMAMGLARPDQQQPSSTGGGGGTSSSSLQARKALVESKTVPGAKAWEWMSLAQEVLNNAQASVDVLNDLLNYDKVHAGNLTLELSILSLWTLVESTVQEFKLAAMERKINLTLDFSPLYNNNNDTDENDTTTTNNNNNSSSIMTAMEKGTGGGRAEEALPPRIRCMRVVGDTVRLSQVIRNLVSNGLKFTPENGDLTVRLRMEPFDGKEKKVLEKEFKLTTGKFVKLIREAYVFVDVIDTGVGMSPDQVAQVFADGTQFNVNKLQAGKGSGLGLYIAKGICKQHGGNLECTSEGFDRGTTFTMKMPLYHIPAPPPPVNNDGPADKTTFMDTVDDYHNNNMQNTEVYPQQILAVDDSAPNLKLLTRLIENRGHRCDGASNGEEAVKLVLSGSDINLFDTILLDYEMPVMNGPTACELMRKSGCSSFIVGITGNVLPEDVAHFKSCGANAVLPKPFKFTALEDLWVEYGVTGRSPPLMAGGGATETSEPPNNNKQQQHLAVLHESCTDER